ncbi:MAG: TULIP family P47-like protein [Spirosomataceae bacterium]
MTTQIDMLGWDTVFGISYKNVNAAIINKKSTPATFTFSNDGISINGTWKDWQLAIGGNGQNLQLNCPVGSGTVTAEEKTQDLAGSTLTIQVKLSQIPDPGITNTSSPGTGGTPNKFVLNTQGTIVDPSVSIIDSSFPHVTGVVKAALPQIFQEYFINNIAAFNHVFAVVDLNIMADTKDYQWLMPTSTSYACAPAQDGSLDKSVFGVLCTTDNASSGLLQQGIDARFLQNMPSGSNSRFAISPYNVLKHILLQGAVLNVKNSTADDFRIQNDKNWIANNKDLTWGNFEIEDGKFITPLLKEGNFQLGVENNFVVIKIIDANCNWTGWHGPGDITLHMNMTQYIELGLKTTKNGWILVPKPFFEKVDGKTIAHGSTSISTTVTSSEGVQIFEICTGIAAAIAASILGAVLGAAFDAASTVTVKSATQGVIEFEMDELTPLISKSSNTDLQLLEEDAIITASDTIANAGNKTFGQAFKAAMAAQKYQLFGGILGSLLGAQIGLIATYMKLAADDDFDSIPTFNKFAAACIGSTTFPGNTGWNLLDANLNGPLLLTGELKITA